jgi:hypothetical protein
MIRKLDAYGDIVLKGNAWATGVEEVKTELVSTLKLFRGEYWRDITLGVPWFESIFKKTPDLSYIGAILKNIIMNVANVKQIIEFNLQQEGRNLLLTVTVLTNFGETIKIKELNVYS